MATATTVLNEDERAIIEHLGSMGCRLPTGNRTRHHIACACISLAATPDGGWGETMEAWRDLLNLTLAVSESQAVEAVRLAGGRVHPSR